MDALKEAGKEALRLALLSAIPIILMGINLRTGTLDINWQLVGVSVLVTILRFADKWLHENGKEAKKEGWLGIGGLTGF